MQTRSLTLTISVLLGCLGTAPASAQEDTAKTISDERAGQLVLIPAGEYLMGSKDGDKGTRLDEKPQHKVKIDAAFYMGAHEVTLGQFRRFVAETNYLTDAEKDNVGGWGYNAQSKRFERPAGKYSWRDTGYPQQPDHPVVNVSFRDVVALCDWLTKSDGTYRYRLPTEAEWEYACRAGTTTLWNSGDDPAALKESANLADASYVNAMDASDPTAKRAASWDDGQAFPATVGSYDANAFGLYDMHGNVGEWCADIYLEDRYLKPAGFRPGVGSDRVVRGGAWNYPPNAVRSAIRHKLPFTERWCVVGFRVVRDVRPADELEPTAPAIVTVPLYRFFDNRLKEHIYSYGEGEPAAWRKRPEMQGEMVLGHAILREDVGTTRLWRYIMPDGRHYFFTRATRVPKEARIEEFVLWVWKRRTREGMIPVFASSMPDGSDMVFSPGKEYIEKVTEETLNGKGVRRRNWGVAFYLYKEPPTAATDQAGK